MKFPTIVSIFLAFITFHTTSFGQITKGNFIIDGGLTSQLRTYNHSLLYTSDGGPIKEHTISFNPSLSYFVSDRLAIGGGVMIHSTTSNLELGSHGLNTHIRYYLSNKNKKALFIENHLGYNEVHDINYISADIGLGLDYFLTPIIVLEGTLSLSYTKRLDFDHSPYGREVNGSRGFSGGIGMGLKFFLNQDLMKGTGNQSSRLRKGTIFLGTTSGGLNFASHADYKIASINLNPNFGVFLNKNWLVGAALNMDYHKRIFLNNSFYNNRNYKVGVAPFIRFYHSTKKGRIVPFYELGGELTRSVYIRNTTTSPFPGAEEGQNDAKDIDTSTAYFGGLGFNLFVSPNVALEFKGSYKLTKLTPEFKTNHFGLDVGFQFFLGK